MFPFQTRSTNQQNANWSSVYPSHRPYQPESDELKSLRLIGQTPPSIRFPIDARIATKTSGLIFQQASSHWKMMKINVTIRPSSLFILLASFINRLIFQRGNSSSGNRLTMENGRIICAPFFTCFHVGSKQGKKCRRLNRRPPKINEGADVCFVCLLGVRLAPIWRVFKSSLLR
jgi:hypothetical protein